MAFNVIPTAATLSAVPAARAGRGRRDAAAPRPSGEARRAAAPQDLEWRVVPPPGVRDARPGHLRALLGARVGAPVDLGFWTEAALFSAAGIDAVVFGPGAHRAGPRRRRVRGGSQLETARDLFLRVFLC